MECLETNKVCTNINKRCKICILDDCKKTLNTIELQEKKERQEELSKIENNLPDECKNCTLLEITNKSTVKCFYRMNGECILNERRK